jgi:hypothetical protein
VYVAAAVVLPLVGSPERMEEAIFPFIISATLVATRTWSVALVWLLAIAADLFAARVGGDARLPTPLAWAGLAVACGLAVWRYFPHRWQPTRTPGPGTIPAATR